MEYDPYSPYWKEFEQAQASGRVCKNISGEVITERERLALLWLRDYQEIRRTKLLPDYPVEIITDWTGVEDPEHEYYLFNTYVWVFGTGKPFNDLYFELDEEHASSYSEAVLNHDLMVKNVLTWLKLHAPG